ncbi:MAG TPA: DNA double-strand break repair nuclease NurA [Anaerolineales bacterium]|nr:DNA double-strand break repair nuclease NurA [Anaerolineales bacterium]
MSIDFQDVRAQVKTLAETAPQRARRLDALRQAARAALDQAAADQDGLAAKIARAVSLNPHLRCAVPGVGRIDSAIPLPAAPERATILAADGSQIFPERNAAADYSLVNVGAIRMRRGSSEKPHLTVRSRLLYDDQMYTENGRITERLVALMRDLAERTLLAELADGLEPPVITLTDGPLELWNAREGLENQQIFDEKFDQYLEALNRLHDLGVSTAGYIDNPASDLVVRMLEIHLLEDTELRLAGREFRPLRGFTDLELLAGILEPCQRSAVFRIQSRTAGKYAGQLALHFFYLHVGGANSSKPYLARVEIPAWVAEDPGMVSDLHAILIEQCRILGARHFPYLLHRSHEVALVTRAEKEQVEAMIDLELRRNGVTPNGTGHKPALKAMPGRTRRG